MEYVISDLESALDGMMDEAPKPRPERKQDVVGALLDRITGVRAKGFTLAEIARRLTRAGMPVSAGSLKSLMYRARREARGEDRRNELEARREELDALVGKAARDPRRATWMPKRDRKPAEQEKRGGAPAHDDDPYGSIDI